MGDDVAVAEKSSHKFFSKSRWRGKSNEEAPEKAERAKLQKAQADHDVNDFLKPSTEKAQAQKEAAAAAFLATAGKPRIDVAKAQRWPAASDLVGSTGLGKSPGIGGLKTAGTRKKGLTVSFVRTQPEIIGEGGDECEEPAIQVAARRKSNSLSDLDKLQAQVHQDDISIGARTPRFHNQPVARNESERAEIVKRSGTSAGERSPPLQKKMEMGSINTHLSRPQSPPRRLGSMGLGERPKPLNRAPTGFDLAEIQGRPSIETANSYDSENVSPVASMKASSLAPTLEEDDFAPKPLKRSQTGWSEHAGDSDEEPAPPPLPTQTTRLPEKESLDDESPIEPNFHKHFLNSEPRDKESFAAKVIHKMRAEEGQALHDAARRATDGSKRDSASSASSYLPQANPFRVGTPPSSYNVAPASAYGHTPPRVPSREPPRSPSALDVESPSRSMARRPSPARRPMPPGTVPLDTDHRPTSSSSSQYNYPFGASRTRMSPIGPSDTATPISLVQRNPSTASSIQPTPPQAYSPNQQISQRAPPPPSHATPITPASASAAAPTTSLGRSDTRVQGEAAYADFTDRVTHMKGIFRLTGELGGQLYDHSPMEWLRVAIWWFLRGRAGMETMIRSRRGEPQMERLTQPHVDLAKTLWILTEVVENHPALRRYGDQTMPTQARAAREAGDIAAAEVYEVHDVIMSYLKMLLASMRKHQVMPPTQALIQGQDQSIWIEYPNFAPDVKAVLSGAANSILADGAGKKQLNPANCIPLGDTKADFCYARMFVTVTLATDDASTDRISMPAVLSVMRPREEISVKLALCSLTELINVFVSNNKDLGPTWRDVKWSAKTRGMLISMRRGYDIKVEFSEQDYASLWSIVDYTNRVDSSIREREDERIAFRVTLRDFKYQDSTNPRAFPPERVKGCKVYIYEKFERSSEGTGKRKLHRGYRLLIVSNPKVKTLNYISHEFGNKPEPLNFEWSTNPGDNAPALVFRTHEEMPDKKIKQCWAYLTFIEAADRNNLFGTLTSMNLTRDETVFARVPLKSLTIESADPVDGFSRMGTHVLKRLKWVEAKTLNTDPEAAGLESTPVVMSQNLRIVCRHEAGSFTDRMNLEPGELLVRLPTNGAAEMTLLRNPQQDFAAAIDSRNTEKDIPEEIAELMKLLTTASTLRTLAFEKFQDLHDFQLAVTGFYVKFDGLAKSFSISRRRMVVPIYKQWTANDLRLQIVQQDNIVQLLAFFEGFSHADAMNFQLKSMDVFESIEKGGKPCVRLVDCKFALPVEERRGEGKMGKEEGKLTGWAGLKRRFVCLDQIEYPGEHDDILIAFDQAETRDRFAEALPAVTQADRKMTLRRKI